MSEFNPDLELQRIVFDFEEKNVLIKCLVDNPSIEIGTGSIKLVKGSEFEVPYWVARILEEEKLIEIKNLKSLDITIAMMSTTETQYGTVDAHFPRIGDGGNALGIRISSDDGVIW